MLIPSFPKDFGEATYEESPLCGEGCLVMSKIILADKLTRKTILSNVVPAAPGWIQVSRWIA